MHERSQLLFRRCRSPYLCALALLTIFSARSWACSCGGVWPSVKQGWINAHAVFLGTVELADPDGTPREVIFREQLVRIRVDEAFKGISKGQTIELHQGATDCDAKFRTGERAVFYLHRGATQGTWIVPACSHALGNSEPDGDDLLFLRGLPQSARGTRLSGEVELYEDSPTEAFNRAGGISKVRVKVSGPQGFTRELSTNESGAYELYGLSPGNYSVSIEVPHGLRLKFPITTGSIPVPNDQAAVKLRPSDGVSVSFVLQADTKISGRILDANGVPVKSICANLESVKGHSEDGASFFQCSKADGSFQMEMMPPGNYWLVARDEVRFGGCRSKSTLYYPGVREKEQAAIVSVEAGHYSTHLDIRLPSGEKRYAITGRMQFSDGTPAAHATVNFHSPEHGYSETSATDADGAFSLSVVAGMEGQLTGQVPILEPTLRFCPDLNVGRRRGLFRILDARPISITAVSNLEGVMLELPSRYCAAPGPPANRK